MSRMRWSPTADFGALRSRLDRLLDDFATSGLGRLENLFSGNWSPYVDIAETQNEFIIRADVPGVHREDIDVTLQDNLLGIQGTKPPLSAVPGEAYRRVECMHGSFLRTLSLPEDADVELASASCKDGVLEIRIGKKDRAKPRQIPVSG